MSFALSRQANFNNRIIACDFSYPMLNIAKQKNIYNNINFIVADMKNLPFKENIFSLATIAFATRNLNITDNNFDRSFNEISRILGQDSVFINLETSIPDYLIRFIFNLYNKLFVKLMGRIFSKSKTAYSYLADSIISFYNPVEFSEILKKYNFDRTKYYRLMFGTICIHFSYKK